MIGSDYVIKALTKVENLKLRFGSTKTGFDFPFWVRIGRERPLRVMVWSPFLVHESYHASHAQQFTNDLKIKKDVRSYYRLDGIGS